MVKLLKSASTAAFTNTWLDYLYTSFVDASVEDWADAGTYLNCQNTFSVRLEKRPILNQFSILANSEYRLTVDIEYSYSLAATPITATIYFATYDSSFNRVQTTQLFSIAGVVGSATVRQDYSVSFTASSNASYFAIYVVFTNVGDIDNTFEIRHYDTDLDLIYEPCTEEKRLNIDNNCNDQNIHS